LFLAFSKNFSECFPVVSGVSTDESSLAHNQFDKIFCMFEPEYAIIRIRQTSTSLPPCDTGAQNSAPSPRGTFLGPKQSFNPQIEMWNIRNQWSFYQSIFCFVLQLIDRAVPPAVT